MVKFLFLFCIKFLEFSSNETKEINEKKSNNEVFDFISYSFLDINSGVKEYGKYGCPSGSRVKDRNSDECIYCELGKTSEYEYSYECNTCLENFQMIKSADNSDEFECRQCEPGQISSNKIDPNIANCNEPNCSDDQYFHFDSDDNKNNGCRKCSDTIDNSIKRSKGSPPLLEYCQCHNKSIKVRVIISGNKNVMIKCVLDLNENKEIFEDFSSSSNKYGYFQILHGEKNTTFINCNPYQKRSIFLYNFCICSEEYIYKDGECQHCSDLIMSSLKIDECICTMGFEINGTKCYKYQKGYYKDNISFDKCKKCNFFFTTKYTGSINEDFCSVIKTSSIIIFVPVLIIYIVSKKAYFFKPISILLDLSSIETNEDTERINNNEVFDFLPNSIIYTIRMLYEKSGYPDRSRVYDESIEECIYCEYCKTNDNVRSNKCNECLQNFEKNLSTDNTDEFECKKCPPGQISIKNADQNNQECTD
ncbi:MAG: hypothetical protein MHPSP_002152, partial [Paramarteilia canceri]